LNLARPIKVVLYAAFIGLLLASYVAPLQQISADRVHVQELGTELHNLREENVAMERHVEELNSPEGVERVARERYGMVRPGERVYIVGEKEE
jgi:cell division protein FtsB